MSIAGFLGKVSCFLFISTCLDTRTVKFVFYYGPKFGDNQYYNISEAQEIVNNEHFKSWKNTVLYIHGYMSKQQDEDVEKVVGVYLNRTDYNVITLYWDQIANSNYVFQAVPGVEALGPIIAKGLLDLFKKNVSLDKFHLVGHSLGAELAGHIGREVIQQSNQQIILNRIDALDPAFPEFYFIKLLQHVGPNDAKYVVVIHTNAGFNGAPYHTGTVDFWPNGGIYQPGCIDLNFITIETCSHDRAWIYWIESVQKGNSSKKFVAAKLKTWNEFQSLNSTELSDITVMGIDTPYGLSGDYFLQTNYKFPFARGHDGINYDANIP